MAEVAAWLELAVVVPAAQREAVEDCLLEAGALAITLLDADADSADEQAIFEPGVGETPLWARIVLQALFPAGRERAELVSLLATSFAWISPSGIRFADIADQDWERAWMDRFQPMRFGGHLWVYPSTIEPPSDPTQVIVRLDPGLAFGTGTHPTTALCLEWLDALDLAGKTVLDYGCGSGVLAIAALKLGAAHVIGIDNDPQALSASRDNAERNDVSGRLDLYLPDEAPATTVDVLVANILAGPLAELAATLAARCRPGARMALSGILENQQQRLLERYATWFSQLETRSLDGWVRIDGDKR